MVLLWFPFTRKDTEVWRSLVSCSGTQLITGESRSKFRSVEAKTWALSYYNTMWHCTLIVLNILYHHWFMINFCPTKLSIPWQQCLSSLNPMVPGTSLNISQMPNMGGINDWLCYKSCSEPNATEEFVSSPLSHSGSLWPWVCPGSWLFSWHRSFPSCIPIQWARIGFFLVAFFLQVWDLILPTASGAWASSVSSLF